MKSHLNGLAGMVCAHAYDQGKRGQEFCEERLTGKKHNEINVVTCQTPTGTKGGHSGTEDTECRSGLLGAASHEDGRYDRWNARCIRTPPA